MKQNILIVHLTFLQLYREAYYKMRMPYMFTAKKHLSLKLLFKLHNYILNIKFLYP